MYDNRFHAAIGAAFLLIAGSLPGAAHALGLGKLSVESNLGEPLRLVIDVNAVSTAEAESLDVSLASRSDFSRAGVEYPILAGLMNFELVPAGGNNYQLVITTEDAINETYMHFLVSAVWSGGKALREYTALLDPPLYSGRPGESVDLAGESAAASAPAPETRSAVTTSPAAAGDVVVNRGDTLSHIVSRMGIPADIDRFQAFLAIFRANPEAFIDNNMNLLRTGAVLDMPSFDEMGAVSRSESVATFSEQLARFTAYQNRVREQRAVDSNETMDRLISESAEQPAAEEAPAAAPVEPQAEPETPSVAEPVAAAPETVTESAPDSAPAAATTETAEPRLTIGQGQEEGAPDGESQAQLDALRAQLAQLDESLLASGVESENVRQNLQQIQSQVDRISTLIEVEDVSLATAQSRAMDSDAPAGESAAQVAEAEAEPEADQPAAMAEPAENQPAGSPTTDTAVADAASDAAGEPVSPGVDPEASVETEVSTESDEILLAQQAPPAPPAGAATGDDAGTGSGAVTDESPAATQDPAADTPSPTAQDDTGAEASATTETTATETGTRETTTNTATAAAEPAGEASATEDSAAQETETAAAESTGEAADSSEAATLASQPAASTRTVSQGGFMDSVKDIFSSLPDYGLKIAAGLLALLGGLFLWQRRKSRKEFDASMLDIETEEVSMNSETSIQRMSDASGIDLASTNDSALELTIGGGMSYLSEEGIAGVNEEDNEVIKAGAVDPLAEADVYLAYDRDEQAIQVLKEAYADNPERGELAEKLLEIYHKQDDRRAFDALAGELHRRTDTTRNVNWERVISMGREVSPENPLFIGDAPRPAEESSSSLDLDDDLLDEPPSGQLNLDTGGLNLTPLESEEDSISNLEVDDLDLVEDTPEEAGREDDDVDAPTLSQIISEEDEARAAIAKAELEIEQAEEKLEEKVKEKEEEIEEALGISLDEPEEEDRVSLSGSDVALDLGGEDQEFELIEAESRRAVADETTAKDDADEDDEIAASLDQDSSMSEMSESSLSKLEPYHESETALELAKAYLELGEQEIAKGFIEEVLNEGSEKQKKKARTMIKDLAT